jgi:hypothetical protein
MDATPTLTCRICSRTLARTTENFIERRSGGRMYMADVCRPCAAAERRRLRSLQRATVVQLHSPRVPDDPAWHAERRRALVERLAGQRERARERRAQRVTTKEG